MLCVTVEAAVKRHPWKAEKVFVTGLCWGFTEMSFVRGEFKQRFVKMAMSLYTFYYESVFSESFDCIIKPKRECFIRTFITDRRRVENILHNNYKVGRSVKPVM